MKRYLVNEMFYSLQGEGCRAGTAAVFLRFAKCNLSCSKLTGEGFDCDTDFAKGEWMTSSEVCKEAFRLSQACRWVIATGGEPTLQLDDELVGILHNQGWKVAIETNGTRPLPVGVDWVCCSPKTGHQPVLTSADEWKFVMGPETPLPPARSGHLVLSPRFDGDIIDDDALEHCIDLVKRHPDYRLSVQQHKGWSIR